MTKRVVITGMGICSPLGNTLDEVSGKLRTGSSGITHDAEFEAMGFAAQNSGRVVGINKDTMRATTPKDIWRTFLEGRLLPMSYYAAQQAVAHSGLTPEQIEDAHAGIVFGNGGPSSRDQVNAGVQTREKGRPRISPFMVLPTMTSGPVAVISTGFRLKGPGYMTGAACATSNIAIGLAAGHIRDGHTPVMLAGGSESADWELACGFDAMQAMTRAGNDQPDKASRPFDKARAGFVIGEGAGCLVLEELEHAKARGATILAELAGYGVTNDGHHLTEPTQDGPTRSMTMALGGYGNTIRLEDVDYINTHGTSTPVGDINEMRALEALWGASSPRIPRIGSTKSMTGHALGAASIHEAIYTLLMMRDGFLAPSINIDELDPEIAELRVSEGILMQGVTTDIDVALSNSFGFGGVNSTVVFRRYNA